MEIHGAGSFAPRSLLSFPFSRFGAREQNLRLPAATLIWMKKLYSFVHISVCIIHFLRAVEKKIRA